MASAVLSMSVSGRKLARTTAMPMMAMPRMMAALTRRSMRVSLSMIA